MDGSTEDPYEINDSKDNYIDMEDNGIKVETSGNDGEDNGNRDDPKEHSSQKKPRKRTSKVWNYIDEVVLQDGSKKAQCKYCKTYFAMPSSGATTQFHRHLKGCIQRKLVDKKQKKLPYTPTGSDSSSNISNFTYDHAKDLDDFDAIEKDIANISSHVRNNQHCNTNESGANRLADNAHPFSFVNFVFRILCPINKVESVVGESNGTLKLLQDEGGVDLKVVDPVVESNECIIIISSAKRLWAQVALFEIQKYIADSGKKNVITTRLLVPLGDIGYLVEGDGIIPDILETGANVSILPREELPACVSGTDQLVQIVGKFEVARRAVIEVTSRLRPSKMCRTTGTPEPAKPLRSMKGWAV